MSILSILLIQPTLQKSSSSSLWPPVPVPLRGNWSTSRGGRHWRLLPQVLTPSDYDDHDNDGGDDYDDHDYYDFSPLWMFNQLPIPTQKVPALPPWLSWGHLQVFPQQIAHPEQYDNRRLLEWSAKLLKYRISFFISFVQRSTAWQNKFTNLKDSKLCPPTDHRPTQR